jgi:hypothetical protein
MDIRSTVLGAGMRRRLFARLDRLDLPSGPADREPVTGRDLEHLPGPAKRYLGFMGVVGRPRDWSLHLRFRGTFRLRPGAGWLPFEAWQYNSAPAVARIFSMRIDVAGFVPMYGVDSYVGGRGRMRGKVLGLVPVANGTGQEFDLSELVTYLNDAVLLAPSMLLDAAVRWTPLDENSFGVTLTDSGTTVTAHVLVDEHGRVRDFSTTDRYCTLPTGLVRARWTTPVDGWTMVRDRPLPLGGRAIWHLPEGPYEYGRGRLDPESVAWNIPPSRSVRSDAPAGRAS